MSGSTGSAGTDAGAPHLTWKVGGTARIEVASADVLIVRSTIPSPPGSRLEADLVGEPAATLKMKIHGSKRQEDGTFRLEGRPLDMTRDVRDRVVALALGAASGG